jgi:flagellar motor switch protein FliG
MDSAMSENPAEVAADVVAQCPSEARCEVVLRAGNFSQVSERYGAQCRIRRSRHH